MSIENQVSLTLSFWREYRTLFHLGRDWNLHESNVSRLVRRIEDILIKSGKFALPGKKRLLESDAIKYAIVDVTGRLIERPKKTEAILFGQEKATRFESSDCHLLRKRTDIDEVFRERKNARLQTVSDERRKFW